MLQRLEGRDRLGERMAPGPMQKIKVEPVGAEALEARLAGLHRALAAGVLRQHLADEKDVVAPAGDRLADDDLGAAIAIHLGGVDEGDAEIETELQRGELGSGFALAFAHHPGAETQHRHLAAIRQS